MTTKKHGTCGTVLMLAAMLLALSTSAYSQTSGKSEGSRITPLKETLTKPKEKHYDATAEIKICAELSDRVQRLVCYDNIATQLGFVPADKMAQREEILEKYGFWEVTRKVDDTGQETIFVKNKSIEQVRSISGGTRRPEFVIACTTGKTDAYSDWRSPLGGATVRDMVVTYQIGLDDPKTETWEVSTDKQALFTPDPVNFIRMLRKNRKLSISVTPVGDKSHTIIHDTDGLNDALKILVDKCYN